MMKLLNDIPFDSSPNYGVRGSNKPELIIIHTASGTYEGTIATFKNTQSKVSAHYVIGREGQVTQMVSLDHAAWHAMHYPNMIGIGIEHADRYLIGGTLTRGAMQDPNWFTLPELTTSAQIVAQLMLKFNIPLVKVIGHNDPYLKQFGNNHTDPGPYFPWLRYRQLINEALAALSVASSAPAHVEAEPLIPKKVPGKPGRPRRIR